MRETTMATMLALMALFLVPLVVPQVRAQAVDAAVTGEVAPPSSDTEDPSTTQPSAGDAALEAVKQGKTAWTAFKGGNYREGIAIVLTLVVFLWRRFLGRLLMDKLSPWATGFVTVLLAFLATIPEALTADPFVLGEFIMSALITSGEAMLLWQIVGKKVLPKVFGAPKKATVSA